MELKPVYKIQDKKLEAKQFSKYSLSIELSLSGFSYSILDTNTNTFIGFEHYGFKSPSNGYPGIIKIIKDIKNKNELLSKPYKNTYVLFTNEKSTLIPLELFREDKKETYLKFNHPITKEDIVLFEKLFNLKACNIFAVSGQLKEFLEKEFPGTKLGHHSGSLIENIIFQNNEKENNIYLHVSQDYYFDILFVKGKRLEFYNNFSYQNAEDFVYYILYVFQQLKLDTEKQKFTVLGNISKQSEEMKLLATYFKNILYGNRNETFHYSSLFEEVPRHQFYNLLNFHV